MEKEKKITIKHYMNTNLKGLDSDNPSVFPIYVLLTYDRKVYRFKSLIFDKRNAWQELDSDGSPTSFFKSQDKNLAILDKEIITFVVKSIINDYNRIENKRLLKRYKHYSENLIDVFSQKENYKKLDSNEERILYHHLLLIFKDCFSNNDLPLNRYTWKKNQFFKSILRDYIDNYYNEKSQKALISLTDRIIEEDDF